MTHPLAKPPAVHNGTYTIAHPKLGHYVVKLYTQLQGALAGRRILALEQPVAFWDDEGQRCQVWRRFASPIRLVELNAYNWCNTWGLIDRKLALWCDLAVRGSTPERHGFAWTEGYTMLLEGRCVICNRPLTDPESIRSGIGPTCAKR